VIVSHKMSNFISYFMATTSYYIQWDDNDVCFVLHQHN